MPRRGRRRKKTRTHLNPVDESRVPGARPTPRTIVIKRGRVGNAVEALVGDLRTVLQPNTATKLRERKRGTLKDYVSVAGPLGVTHLLLLSTSATASTEFAAPVPLLDAEAPAGVDAAARPSAAPTTPATPRRVRGTPWRVRGTPWRVRVVAAAQAKAQTTARTTARCRSSL